MGDFGLIGVGVVAAVFWAARWTERGTPARWAATSVFLALIGAVYSVSGAGSAGWMLLKIASLHLAIWVGWLAARVSGARR